MRRNLQGRRVLITGASGGIGRALALRLGQAGARLALSGRSAERLEQTAEEVKKGGTEVHCIAADITLEGDRRRLLDQAAERLGGLDVLVNNAGIASWAHFANSTEEILRQIMEVNFFAPAELIRSAIPILVNGDEPAVVNVASMCGRKAMPAWSEYSASKYALCGLTEALRGELARFDIDILLIVPGLTSSDFSRHVLKSEGRAELDFTKGMPPDVVADRIVRSLEKNKTETVIGSDAKWMLRFNKFFPRWLDRILARRVKKLYETA
jgi:short-subunit dehydrogenase